MLLLLKLKLKMSACGRREKRGERREKLIMKTQVTLDAGRANNHCNTKKCTDKSPLAQSSH